ncbi:MULTISPECIES: AAA family ATPase [unclassified Microbacterium]|uniref:AAA family ATPase n=1 Tax=unclassified Microbacterium TaxID=2609290 RepID=UPI00214D1059|nr:MULTISPECIES: AAA family ATPase [unclassified Microbacterium]MCR2784141.1 AAA family ATPase [Microbacterium sp. zg.B96]WIM15023.1 AAA family ATPase [Microbacterium sp. zg-B96]
MLVVAASLNAASVASREVGAAASSLHALLFDHGYRWGADSAGAEVRTRLSRGDADQTTGMIYDAPTKLVLYNGDRIVVDEAGMVDLRTAAVLVDFALERSFGVAMVGDPYQALPVVHAGAMATAVRYATASVELDTVHGSALPNTPRSRCACATPATATML